MQHITNDPMHAICPSFEDPGWEFLQLSLVNAHPGPQPLTTEEATQQLKEAWTRKNAVKVGLWNTQVEQDTVVQVERDRVAHKLERAQQEAEAKERCQEAERKKPKFNSFDPALFVEKWIEPRPASYALHKLDNLEYVKLDYFTERGCKQAGVQAARMFSNNTLGLTQLEGSIALHPMASLKSSSHVRGDEELSWEEVFDAKNVMLHFMNKSGVWPHPHSKSIASFYFNLELHPQKLQLNGRCALIHYQSRVQREWFDALKRDQGFNIELIQEDLLRAIADELNNTIRDRENTVHNRDNVAHDREIEMVHTCSPNVHKTVG
ncbi:hypothetical protein EI94DRAFT_1817556 [Lactarius quietus]|nr:hypothetical protein EI94DRAFT_1817556 [Lactarius quietus]